MKTNFKRLFALVLTLCMLATLMVPVAFAEDEAVAAPSANVAETYNIRLVDMTQVDASNRTGWNTYFGGSSGYKSTGVKAFNDDGTPSYNTKIIDPINAAYADGTLDWKFLESQGEATYREDRMMQLRSSGWVALQIRVSASGMYALNIATDKNDPAEGAEWTNNGKTQSGNVAAYIVPVADFSVENIDAILVDENSVGTVYLSADATSVTFAKQRMEAGEYVVIYDGPSDYSVCEMSLLGDAYEMENVATYDMNPFDLSNTDITTWAGTVNESIIAVVDGSSSNDYVNVGTGVDYETFGWSSYTYSGTWRAQAAAKFDPCLKSAGNWAAIKLNVPASGEQYLSLTTDRMDVSAPFSNSFGKKIIATVSAYLIPVAEVANKDAVAGLIEAGTGYIGTRSLFSTEDKTMTFDKAFLEAGQYVLVIKLEAVEGGRYPISQISLDKVAGQDLPESEKVTGTVATYNFELYDTVEFANFFITGYNEDGTPTWGGRSMTNKAYGTYEGYYEEGDSLADTLNSNYAKGQLNWTVATSNNIDSHNMRAVDKDGFRIQKLASETEESAWTAIKVNVPIGGLYNADIVSEYTSNASTNVYVLPAGADIEAGMTEDNLVTTISDAKGMSFRATFSAGDNLIVFKINETAKKATIYLSSLTLSVASNEVVSYSMDLMNNDAFDAILSEMSGGIVTEATLGNVRYRTYTNAEGAETRLYYYNALANLFVRGDINWYLDTIQVAGKSTDTQYGMYSIDGSAESSNIRMKLEGTTENDFGSIRIRVPAAGTYAISIAATCIKNDGISAYIVPAPSDLTAHSSRISAEFGDAAAVEANLMGSSTSNKGPITGDYTFESSGEYIIILKHNNNEDGSIYVSSIDMTPVEADYIADGKGYTNFEAAVADATKSIMLLANAEAGSVVVPAGVTLDLNGYTLYATSVDASAPGAQIIDAMDGKALIRGDITFNENNAQLPLYDIDADGYYLFNVDVDSHATTGTGSKTKFWFKVAFSNAKAYDMIGMATELRIVADMTGVYKETTENHTAGDAWAATAKSSAKFVNTWADNNSSYIVVSAVGSGISSFKLNPGVSANGVSIFGSAMGKGTAA